MRAEVIFHELEGENEKLEVTADAETIERLREETLLYHAGDILTNIAFFFTTNF